MSVAEVLLIIGTFGICTGVWTTLVVILRQNSKSNKQASTYQEATTVSTSGVNRMM